MANIAQGAATEKMAVMNLLSDAEVAKVSSAEGAQQLAEGDHFLDLDHLELGVQRASVMTTGAMSHIIPQSAVSAQTWTKIIDLLQN
jgi:hypothetical protein